MDGIDKATGADLDKTNATNIKAYAQFLNGPCKKIQFRWYVDKDTKKLKLRDLTGPEKTGCLRTWAFKCCWQMNVRCDIFCLINRCEKSNPCFHTMLKFNSITYCISKMIDPCDIIVEFAACVEKQGCRSRISAFVWKCSCMSVPF